MLFSDHIVQFFLQSLFWRGVGGGRELCIHVEFRLLLFTCICVCFLFCVFLLCVFFGRFVCFLFVFVVVCFLGGDGAFWFSFFGFV